LRSAHTDPYRFSTLSNCSPMGRSAVAAKTLAPHQVSQDLFGLGALSRVFFFADGPGLTP